MDSIFKDIRFAVRSLIRQPSFTVIALSLIALGIGANAGIFSLTTALLLRPPKGVDKADEIVVVGRTFSGSGFSTFSYPDYEDCRDQNRTLVNLAAYRDTELFLDTGGAPELLSGMLVSGNYFTTLGTRAEVGRLLMPDDDGAPGANPVIVISHGLWQRRFASDPNIVGRIINFNNFPFTIVGVMQPDFTGTGLAENIEVWLPVAMYAQANPDLQEKRLELRQVSWLNVLGRRKTGITIAQAQADLASISHRLEQIYPDIDMGLGVSLAEGLGLEPQSRDEASSRMTILLVVTGLVLLIVCANVGNLLLAKSAARRKEFAVRQALGAGRARIVRQLLTEALLLSTIGGILGVIFAIWSRAFLLRFNFLTGVRLSEQDLRFDARVIGFSLLVSVVTGVAFGLVPAIDIGRLDLQLMLKDRSAISAPRSRFRAALVVGQVALSLVVLIAGGLFIRTLRNSEAVDPGFDVDKILLMSIDVGRRGYSEEQGRLFYQRLIERVRSIPGVDAASLTVTTPLGGSWRAGLRVEGQPATEPDVPCDYNMVAPHYFQTAGIALIQGRDFTNQDGADSPRVIIINETFARRMFPHDTPLGKRLAIPRFKGDKALSEIVGVAKDVKYERLTESPRPYFYEPLSQQYQSGAVLIVRARGDDASGLVGVVTHEVGSLDKTLAVNRVRTLAARLQASIAPQRSAATMLAIFGLLGLGLASLGLYGVLSYSVRQRQQEIGIRMALGANRRDILKVVLRQGAILIIVGVALGLSLAFATARAIAGLLFGVSPADPVTFAVVTIALVVTALVACYIPARRATKVDPMVVLRYE